MIHTSRIQRTKGGANLWVAGAALFLLALALSAAVVGQAGRHSAGSPAPVYVNRVSSMIGSADGTLIEGGVPAPATSTRGGQTAGWMLLGVSLLGLSAVALTGFALYRTLRRRLR